MIKNIPMPSPKSLMRLVTLSAVATITACTSTSTLPPAPAPLTSLLAAMSERLTVADQVALTKWDSGKPIQDSPRETQVIANGQQQAVAHGLEAEDFGQFMAAQIEANKLIQYALLARWQEAGEAPKTPRPDLVKQIRPQLDQLQTRLLQSYAAFAPYRQDPQCPNWLTQQRHVLARDAVHDLALIRATGQLCAARE
jgi:chorismate mutase